MKSNDYIFGKKIVLTSSSFTASAGDKSATALQVLFESVSGATKYEVYLDNVLIQSTSLLQAYATNLTSGTSYTFLIQAKDDVGTLLAESNTLNMTTDASISTAIETESILECWKMDEPAGEFTLIGSVRGYEATSTQEIAYTHQGIVGTGTAINRTNNTPFVSREREYDLSLSNKLTAELDFSISVWVFIDSIDSNPNYIISKRGPIEIEWELYFTPERKVRFNIYSSSSLLENTTKWVETENTVSTFKSWYHIAVINKVNKSPVLLVNGKVTNGNIGTNYTYPYFGREKTEKVHIHGVDFNDLWRPVHQLDEHIIWKNGAPSVCQMSDIYNNGNALVIDLPSNLFGQISDLTYDEVLIDSVWLYFTKPYSQNELSHYEIYVNNLYYGDSNNLNFIFIKGLQTLTTYDIQILAVDTLNNKSSLSNILQVTTEANPFLPLDQMSFYNTSDIVAYYKFNQNLNDTSTNLYHGTPTDINFSNLGGLPTAVFNGVSSMISLPDPAGYNQSQTISFWYRADFSLLSVLAIYSKGSDSSNGWGTYISVGNRNINFNLVVTSPTAFFGTKAEDIYGINNKFNHFASSWDDTTNTTKIYINGDEIASEIKDGTTLRGSTDVVIGANTLGTYVPKGFFNGELADFAIINRVLTPTEIAEIAQK